MKIISSKNIIKFSLIFAFVLIASNTFSQDTTNTDEILPYDLALEKEADEKKKQEELEKQATAKDSVVTFTKTIDKPGTFVGNILHYLSPIKEETVTLRFPYPVESDTIVLSHHEIELRNKNTYGDHITTETDWNKISDVEVVKNPKIKDADYYRDSVRLHKQVYGYHPYWMGTAYKNYDFGLLSRVAYFSLPLDPATGNFKSERLWRTTNLIEEAHEYGCEVDLCITNFGSTNNSVFLENPEAQDKFIENLKEILVRRKNNKIEKDKNGNKLVADGVNINFEGIHKKNKQDYVDFIQKLDTELGSSYKITVTIPAIDWQNAYDIVKLQEYVEFFFLMAYDFYGKYSKQAGPTSLLYSGGTWGTTNISNTVENYLKLGIKKHKLILGLPYYANEWETKSSNFPSDKRKFIGARTYSYVADNYSFNTTKINFHYDTLAHSVCYYYRTKEGKWRQCWGDNEQTLGAKYDYVINKELGGVGIWALGYDNGYYDLWNLLADKFTHQRDPDREIKREIEMSLASNVITRSTDIVKKTEPRYKTRFYNKINRFWNFFVLFFAIVLVFAIVGFIVAISDFDVRFVLFNKEVRVYMFFILISVLTLFFLRVIDVVLSTEIYFIVAIAIGIAFALMILKVGNMKKEKQGEEKP